MSARIKLAITQLQTDIVKRRKIRAADSDLGPTVCVNTSPPACTIRLLKLFFEEWCIQLGRGDGLASVGPLRIFSMGDDAVIPTAQGRDGVGLPSAFKASLGKLDAFNAFRKWNNIEVELVEASVALTKSLEHGELQTPTRRPTAVYLRHPPLGAPDANFAPALDEWEHDLGLNFTWFSTNLVASHHRLRPLPLGPAAHALKELQKVRSELLGRWPLDGVASHRKEYLLLLNFKASGGMQGSSEREAIYRLAANGAVSYPSPTHKVDERSESPASGEGVSIDTPGQPWEFASIQPRYGAAGWDDSDLAGYFRALASFHFVLSPRGNGLDCYR